MPQAPTLPPPADDTKTVEFDRFVDKRIHQTRSAVKATDLMVGLAKLAAAALALLLAAAVVEHWVVPGGFGQTERVALFVVALLGALLYSARRLLPVLLHRVNPLYAAAEIERGDPGLKNALVNLLQLRSTKATPEGIRKTLERQAAERLVASPEATVDRAALVRVGYVLLALVGVIGLYVVLSPKDLFATAARVAMPWADIAAPTRVRILDLEPGATTVSQGTTLEVSARLTGLAEGDTAELLYSTRDGRSVDQSLPLTLDDSGIRYRATLPADGRLGLQTSLRYRLAAGDARTSIYEVRVLAAPTIAPVRVAYDYPDYTGYADRVVDGVGDISAIEGTRVTLTAEANLPIDAAQIDLDADGRPNHRMKAEETTASGRLTLRREPNSGVAPRQSFYVLRFTSRDGQANTDPAKYRYEVTPDLAPEATVLRPEAATVDVALGEEVEVVVEARDPDFALSSVKLRGEVDRRGVLDEALLVDRQRKGFRGKFSRPTAVDPERLGLRIGDVLTYWVEATDNRAPEPNRVVTSRKRVRVIGDRRQQDRQGGEGEASESGGASQGGEGEGKQGQEQGQQEGSPANDEGASQGNEGDQSEGGQQSPNQDQRGGEGSDQQQQRPEQDQQAGEQGAEGGEPNELRSDEGQSGEENPGDARQQDGVRGTGEAGEDAQQSESQGGAPGDGDSPNEGDNTGDQPGAGGQGERRPGQPTGGPNQPVARDGSDDGAAFDRIREHLAERERSEGNRESRDSSDAAGERSPSEDSGGDPREGRPEMADGQSGDDGAGLQQRDAVDESLDRPEGRSDAEPGAEGGQSDSQNNEAGAEGGEEQSSDTRESNDPREGTGDSGQNQAADEGAGQSADQGTGERSGQAGEQQLADEPTGESSGDQRGAGSETGATGEQTEGESEGSPEAAQGSETSPTGESSDAAGDARGGENGTQGTDPSSGESAPDGGTPGNNSAGENPNTDPRNSNQDDRGQPGDSGASPRGGQRDGQREEGAAEPTAEPGGDEANLEFARRQTDLVLERLSEQLEREGPDKDLLDKLGWSEDDLRRFVARWRERQQRAAQGGDAAEAELDDALRSLGLGREGPKSTGALDRDELRDLRERARTTVPPAIRDRLKTYNRGVSAAEQDGR